MPIQRREKHIKLPCTIIPLLEEKYPKGSSLNMIENLEEMKYSIIRNRIGFGMKDESPRGPFMQLLHKPFEGPP